MSEQTFKIRKVGGNFVAFDTIDKKRSYGRINIKTGKFVGDTRCLIVLNNHLDKFIESDYNTPTEGVTYKLWVTIERIDENKGTYENLEQEETRSVGEFSTVNEAREQMNLLGDSHQGKH
jgi:hypothetical protein